MGTLRAGRWRQQILLSDESGVFAVGSLMLVAWLLAIAALWRFGQRWEQWVIMGFTELLLGRGVDAPMPVILIGALGGMAHSGILGLFVGATLLTLGYQILMDWVQQSSTTDLPETTPTADSEPLP